jgi:hypothetical protein
MGPDYNQNPGQNPQTPPNYRGPAGPYVPQQVPPGPPSPLGPYGAPQQPYNNPQQPYAPQPYAPGGPPPDLFPPNPYAEFTTGPVVDPYDEKGAKKAGGAKIIAVSIAAVALISIIIAVLVAASQNKPAPQTPQPQQQTEAGGMADVVARPDGSLDLSKRLDTSKSVRSQTVQAKINEQVNLSSGFSFMVKGIDDYDSATIKPSTGKKFVILLVAAGNRAQSGDLSVSYLDFKLRDSSNRLLNGHPATQQVLNNLLASPTELKPGEQIEGRLIYEVELAEKEWTLVHKETYQKTTDGTTFTVEGRIAVKLQADSDDSSTGSTRSGSDTNPSPSPTPATTPPPAATQPTNTQ